MKVCFYFLGLVLRKDINIESKFMEVMSELIQGLKKSFDYSLNVEIVFHEGTIE